MPISLRLPLRVEEQIAEYSVRQGISKSAVIVRSIETFLAEHAQPNAYQLYLDAMQQTVTQPASGAQKAAAGATRPHKLAIKQAVQKKHAGRSARATRALNAAAAKPVVVKPAGRKAA